MSDVRRTMLLLFRDYNYLHKYTPILWKQKG
jgi:hypothetical protein